MGGRKAHLVSFDGSALPAEIGVRGHACHLAKARRRDFGILPSDSKNKIEGGCFGEVAELPPSEGGILTLFFFANVKGAPKSRRFRFCRTCKLLIKMVRPERFELPTY